MNSIGEKIIQFTSGSALAVSQSVFAANLQEVITLVAAEWMGFSENRREDNAAVSSLIGICMFLETLELTVITSEMKAGIILTSAVIGAVFGSDLLDVNFEQKFRQFRWCMNGIIIGETVALLTLPYLQPSVCALAGFLIANTIGSLYQRERPFTAAIP